MNRECGTCTACCTTMIVPELNKAAHCDCPFANNGCTMYEDRPPTCADWNCLWLLGHFRDRDRPDKTGYVSWVMPAPQVRSWGHPVVAMREIKEGSTVIPAGQRAIKKLTKAKVSVIVIKKDTGRTIYAASGFQKTMRESFNGQGIEFSERSGSFHISREDCERMWPMDYAQGDSLRKLISIG